MVKRTGFGGLLLMAAAVALGLSLPSCGKREAPAPEPSTSPTTSVGKTEGTPVKGPESPAKADAEQTPAVPLPKLESVAKLLESLKTAPKPEKKVKIGIVTNAIAPFWMPMTIGMERAAGEFGCQASWAGPPNAQVVEQKRKLEEMVAKGVNGISVSPINADAVGPFIDEMAGKGLLMITMDSDAPNSKRLLYIGTNNYNAGLEAGEQAAKILGEKGGKVIAFVGVLAAQNAQDRLRGFKDAAKEHNIEVLDVRQDQTDKEKARKNVEEVLQSHPDIDALLGLWSYNGPAIAKAVKEAGKLGKVRIVSFDAEPATLGHLKKGEIDVTIVQKPYLFGYLSVAVLYSMVSQGVDATLKLLPSNRIIDTGVEAVTPQNVEDYLAGLKALGIKSS